MFLTNLDFLQNQEHPMFNIDNLSLGLISNCQSLVCKKECLNKLCKLYYFSLDWQYFIVLWLKRALKYLNIFALTCPIVKIKIKSPFIKVEVS